jgi:hypothetical protein
LDSLEIRGRFGTELNACLLYIKKRIHSLHQAIFVATTDHEIGHYSGGTMVHEAPLTVDLYVYVRKYVSI